MSKDEALKIALNDMKCYQEGTQVDFTLAINTCKEALKQQAWKGLTDDEIQNIRLKTFDSFATNYEAYRAIEQALRIKNDYQS